MAQRISMIQIDSKLRTSGTSSDFTIKIDPALYDLSGTSLLAVNIPLTQYIVNSTNNHIYFNANDVDYDTTMLPGVYDISSLLIVIKSAMEGAGYPGIIQANFDYVTYLLTISGSTEFYFTWGAFSSNSASYLLGFDNEDTILGYNQISDHTINLSVPPCIFIRINEFPVMCRSSNGVNGTYPIYTVVNSGSINFFLQNTDYESKAGISLSNHNILHVSLIDPRTGLIFDLNGSDWCFLLKLNY